MNDTKDSRVAGKRTAVVGRMVVGVLMGVGLVLGGCSENRIGMNEFLRIQEADQQCPWPQPEAKVEADRMVIEQSLGRYVIGSHDVLTLTLITALDQTSLSPPILVRVDQNGQIMLPMVGTMDVGGREILEAEEVIRNAYVPSIYRDMAVYLDVFRPDITTVMVSGAVGNPGLIPLVRSERNLLYALVGAGGVSEMASGKVTLQRLREPDAKITLNLMDPEDLKKALAIPPLEKGDMVTVQAAVPNIVFVGGLVNAPQPQAYPPGVEINVLQALAASGGLRTDVNPREGTLIRRMPDGRDIHVKLNLDRITKGKDPNITLAAGDILWVPYTVATRVEEWINQNIYIRGGVSASVQYNVSGVEYLNRRSQQTGRTQDLQSQYDPFGFLQRNTALQNLMARPVPIPLQ